MVLLTVSDKSIERPAELANDFAAAVACYPGVCAEKWQTQPYTEVPPQGWTTHVPLLVLMGEDDVWTEPKPCEAFLSAAKARGNAVELITYARAVHVFDSTDTQHDTSTDCFAGTFSGLQCVSATSPEADGT